MPTNLVASVTNILTPQLLSRVASAFGLDRAALEKAVAAAVPALLTVFTSLVAKPGGAAKLGDAVAQQPTDMLAGVANVIGAPGTKDLIDSGLGSLSSLLGGSTVSALAGAVGRYAGLGEGGSKSLMGLLGPMVMGVLGQQQRANGLDAQGLTQLLQSQKGNIARALPPGFADYLSSAGLLDRTANQTVKDPAWRAPADQSPQWNWVVPVLGVLALGALAWYLFGRNPEQTVATLPPAAVEAPRSTSGPATFIVTADKIGNWIGKPVYSSDDKKIGEIIEIKRDPNDKVTDIYVDTGTFLGMGATRYRITSDQVQEVKPDGVVLTLKEVEAKPMPQATEKPQP